MRKLHPQAGITAIGLILTLIPIGFLAYIGLRIAPVYIEGFSVGDAVTSLRKEADLKERSKDEIYVLLQKRLAVNDIRSVGKDDVKIIKTVNDVTIKVDYEVRVPIAGNMALVMTFNKSTVIR